MRYRRYDRIPWYLGVCYFDLARDESVCLPLGLNMLGYLIREAWIYVRYAPSWKEQHNQAVRGDRLYVEVCERREAGGKIGKKYIKEVEQGWN